MWHNYPSLPLLPCELALYLSTPSSSSFSTNSFCTNSSCIRAKSSGTSSAKMSCSMRVNKYLSMYVTHSCNSRRRFSQLCTSLMALSREVNFRLASSWSNWYLNRNSFVSLLANWMRTFFSINIPDNSLIRSREWEEWDLMNVSIA